MLPKQAVQLPWYEQSLIKDLPLPHRLYAWWIRNGFKRQNGFTWGGNKLFELVRSTYTLLPSRNNNYVSIPACENRFQMVVDLTDFEVPHHTIPLSLGTGSEARLLELFFPRGGTFIDVGANYGFYSLLASYLGGKQSVVCAFEPQPRLVKALEMSKQQNQFSQLRIKRMVLGEKPGEVSFFIPDTGSGVGSLYREHASSVRSVREHRVRMESLDTVFQMEKLQRLDIVKLDVEGAELAVLKGGAATINLYHPIIWFEMDPGSQEVAGHKQEEIYSFLEGLGYRRFYDVDDVMLGLIRPVSTVNTLTNVLALSESKAELLNRLIPGTT
jgi:FkbM family methyltransferase